MEAGFANALSLHIGDQLTFDGVSVRVVGTAVTAAIPSYPKTCAPAPRAASWRTRVSADNPGLIWTTQTDVGRIVAATSGPEAYFLNLKLDRPRTAAGAFADRSQRERLAELIPP